MQQHNLCFFILNKECTPSGRFFFDFVFEICNHRWKELNVAATKNYAYRSVLWTHFSQFGKMVWIDSMKSKSFYYFILNANTMLSQMMIFVATCVSYSLEIVLNIIFSPHIKQWLSCHRRWISKWRHYLLS